MREPFQFTAEDFSEIKTDTDVSAFAAELAQKKLAEWLADAPVVYGEPLKSLRWSPAGHLQQTHRARLVCIEEIKK